MREERQSTLFDRPPDHQTGYYGMRLLARSFLQCTLGAPEFVLGHQTLRRRPRICKAVLLRVFLSSVLPRFRIGTLLRNKISTGAEILNYRIETKRIRIVIKRGAVIDLIEALRQSMRLAHE
jgi:hypothetical protein